MTDQTPTGSTAFPGDVSASPLPPGTAMKVGADDAVSAIAVIDRYESHIASFHREAKGNFEESYKSIPSRLHILITGEGLGNFVTVSQLIGLFDKVFPFGI